jgi:hypothetical protein
MRRLFAAAVAVVALCAFAGTAAARTPSGSFVGILCQHDNPTQDYTCGTRNVTANTPFYVSVTNFCGSGSGGGCVSDFRFTLSVSPDVSYSHFTQVTRQPDGTVAVQSIYSFDQGLPPGSYSFHWQLYTTGKLVYQGTTPFVSS